MKSKKLIAICLLSTVLLVGCGGADTDTNEGTKDTNSNVEQTEGFTGTKTYEKLYDETGKKGDVIVTEVEFENGTPVNVAIDVLQENGTMKKDAAANGEYVMTEGEEHHWGEQIELLETYIEENDFDLSKVTLSTDEGNTDAVSGVSIKVSSYLTAVEEVLNAVESGTELPDGFTGVKSVTADYDPTGEKKDKVIVDVVYSHGEPVNVHIDVEQENGTMKKDAAANGEYVMTEGEEHHWGEQIELLETYIVENDFDLSKVTLSTDEGNTDAVSGVSIKVSRYLEVVQEVLDSNN